MSQLTGDEEFTFDNKELGFNMLDFWKFHFSNIYNMQSKIAEFIVSKALGLNEAQNCDYWTLFDMLYKGFRIEVKETSYYHPWNENGNVSNKRSFDIKKANSNYEDEESENRYERQNDIYIFCVNNGKNQKESYPLNLDNWDFYIIPTKIINEQCGDAKSVSLGRLKNMGYSAKNYFEIRSEVDNIIEELSVNYKIGV